MGRGSRPGGRSSSECTLSDIECDSSQIRSKKDLDLDLFSAKYRRREPGWSGPGWSGPQVFLEQVSRFEVCCSTSGFAFLNRALCTCTGSVQVLKLFALIMYAVHRPKYSNVQFF